MSAPDDRDWLGGMKVHPLADLAPMLSDDQLASLAEDIAANGLQHPIVRTTDGKTIVDGRNRKKACKIAGVVPSYLDIIENDDEAAAARAIASHNLERRDLSASQKAMWRAFLYPKPEHGGDRRSTGFKLTESTRTDPALLSRARAVLDYSPALAKLVLLGDPNVSLNSAYEQATALARQQQQQAAEDRRLRSVAPDLMRRVENGELTRAEARAIWEKRDREGRDIRHAVFRTLHEFIDLSRGILGTTPIAELPEWLNVDEFDSEFREFFKGGAKQLVNDAADVRAAAETIQALADKLNRRVKK